MIHNKFIQITSSAAIAESSALYEFLYALTEDGEVYKYTDDLRGRRWEKVEDQ